MYIFVKFEIYFGVLFQFFGFNVYLNDFDIVGQKSRVREIGV